MNPKPQAVWRAGAMLGLIVLCGPTSMLGGCHKTPPSAGTPAAADERSATDSADAADESAGVSLTPEEVRRMGIVTVAARVIMRSPEATGFGVILAHENIATAVAELDTAVATERQSRAALDRSQRLAGTAGAMPADTLETAQRQASVDQAALELARRKISSMFGQNSPWKNQSGSPQLLALARGDAKLARVTFPLGEGDDALPASLRLAPINASRGRKSIETRSLWSAPADASVPGRSYFAYLKAGDFREGEHVLAWLPMGEAESGVLVPAAAAVINAGRYWCYVEEKPGQFVRSELDPNMSTPEGYFVKQGIDAGARIVTTSAGALLAREINPSTAAD
jgi:hypothetical protein